MHEQQTDPDSGDLLEAYIDGELTAPQARQLEARLQRDAALAQQLDLARRIRQELRALPHHACPATVGKTPVDLQAARRQTSGQSPKRNQSHGRTVSWRTLRPLLAAAAVLATVIALRPTQDTVTTPQLQSLRPEARAYSDAEVAQAQADVKRALAYLGQLGATASQRVHEDLAQPRWAQPLQRLMSKTGPTGN